VFLELGYALGRGKVCIPIIRTGATVPSDIAGFERLTNSSYKELSQVFKGKVQEFILLSLKQKGPMRKVAHNEFIRYLQNHTGGQEVDVDSMKKELRTHHISGLEVDESVSFFLEDGLMAEQNGKIILTPKGEDLILKLLPMIPEHQK